MNTESEGCTAKIFWEQNDDNSKEENTAKLILPNVYNQPAKIVNSSCVNVKAKPWLLKNKNRAAQGVTETTCAEIKMNVKNLKSKVKMDNKNDVEHVDHVCSLTELRHEDKQRVASLVREMAKFSEEKEVMMG